MANSKLLEDMKAVFQKAKHSDVTLRAENKELRAHKAILAERSPVFDRMFAQTTEENALGSVVDIPDMTHETLQRFVGFLYCGQVDNLTVESASGLFVASDTYGVEELCETCTVFLQRYFTVDNCLEVLLLADSYGNARLKKVAIDFIADNSREICAKPDWDELLKKQPHLSHELLKVFMRK